MRKHLSLALVVAALVLLTSACGDDETAEEVEQEARETATTITQQIEQGTRLRATLTGAAEVPAGDPDGSGTASINLDVTKGEVCYDVTVQNLDRPVGMHIHEGEAGKNGPIVVQMTTPTATGTTTRGCTNADGTLMGRLAARPGDFYLNVHTEAFQQGAIRGQLSQ
jgi:hypothetical protein